MIKKMPGRRNDQPRGHPKAEYGDQWACDSAQQACPVAAAPKDSETSLWPAGWASDRLCHCNLRCHLAGAGYRLENRFTCPTLLSQVCSPVVSIVRLLLVATQQAIPIPSFALIAAPTTFQPSAIFRSCLSDPLVDMGLYLTVLFRLCLPE